MPRGKPRVRTRFAAVSITVLLLAAGCATSRTTDEPLRPELRAGSTSDLVKYAYFSNHVDLPSAWDQGMPIAVREFDPRRDDYAYVILAVHPPPSDDRRDFVVRGTVFRPDGSKDNAEVRWNATETLRGFGTVAPVDVAQSLSRGLRDVDARVRGAAARGLAELAPLNPAAIQVIAAGLADGNARTRAAAVDAISALAPRGSGEVMALARVLKDPDVTVRLNAVRVIGDIGRSASAAARSFRTSGVADAATSHERTARNAAAALLLAEEDPTPEVRAEAELALRDIGRP